MRAALFKIYQFLLAKWIQYTQQMKQLCLFGKHKGQISPMILDVSFFFLLQNMRQKYASYCSFFQKPQNQVWGKGTFRNNGKAPPSSLYWGHKAAWCFTLDGDVHTRRVQGVCPKLCTTALTAHVASRAQISREFKLGQRSKTSSYLSGVLGIFSIFITEGHSRNKYKSSNAHNNCIYYPITNKK